MGKRGKAHLGYEIERDVKFVRLLREAIGPDALLIMDRGQSLVWTRAEAIKRTNSFEEYGLYWIEEPLEPSDTDGFLNLRQNTKCIVGAGEREWTTRGFGRVIGSGVVDVVSCDPGRAEGITGALKVIELVENADVWFNAHAWSSAVITAVSLALSASTPPCLLFEMKLFRTPRKTNSSANRSDKSMAGLPCPTHRAWASTSMKVSCGSTISTEALG